MDRNSLIGFVLIGLILLVYTFQIAPSEEEKVETKRLKDSIEQVEVREAQQRAENQIQTEAETATAMETTLAEELPVDSVSVAHRDSLSKAQLNNKFGSFSGAANGENEYLTIENELIKATISTLGGRVASVELKQYKTTDSLPLLLFTEDSSRFDILFFDVTQRSLHSSELFFDPQGTSFEVTEGDSNMLALRLNSNDPNKYIEFQYSLKGNSYELDYDIKVVGMDDLLRENSGRFDVEWDLTSLAKEKSLQNEQTGTTVYFQYGNEEIDYVSETSYESEELISPVRWIAFKQHFFNATIIADEVFSDYKGEVATHEITTPGYTKKLTSSFSIPFGHSDEFGMRWYFGPNHYQTLAEMGIGLENQIELGWTIFGWVNEWLVIPIFNFLDTHTDLNYGIIILILTLLIKIILFPLTYKNYKSSAKMRVLKPEIDELNEKHKNDDALKKQQATMALYRQAGVNPMAGCIPMVLQMPILYAMFRFFPASIELRQESFLWADDLSSYDSILELPWDIPMYGDHVSLFTLLMAFSTFFYTKYNMQMTGSANAQFPQMKMMIYFMPIMLLVFFNSYSSGLSYYYLTANVISIAQQFTIKKFFINEDAIHRKIQENKKKSPNKKKSKFQKRLEDISKQQQQKATGKQKSQGKKR